MRRKLTRKEKSEVENIKDPHKRSKKRVEMGAFDDGVYPTELLDDDDDDFLYGLFPQGSRFNRVKK